MPKFEEFAWGPSIGRIPQATTNEAEYGDVLLVGTKDKHTYDTIFANYLILSAENNRLRAAYVAFPGHGNFDKVTKRFSERYGEPDKSGLAPDSYYWFGDSLDIRLQYQVNTDEGILALTFKGMVEVIGD